MGFISGTEILCVSWTVEIKVVGIKINGHGHHHIEMCLDNNKLAVSI